MLKASLVVVALCAALLTGRIMLGEFNAVVWISVGFAGFAVSKLLLTNLMPTGHGVNGRRHILGMPIVLFVGYLVILVLALLLGLVDVPALLPVTNANFRVLGLSIFYGWMAALIDWYAFSYKDTYYASEYEVLVMLKARGVTSDEVKDKIIMGLRAKGYLRPLSKKK